MPELTCQYLSGHELLVLAGDRSAVLYRPRSQRIWRAGLDVVQSVQEAERGITDLPEELIEDPGRERPPGTRLFQVRRRPTLVLSWPHDSDRVADALSRFEQEVASRSITARVLVVLSGDRAPSPSELRQLGPGIVDLEFSLAARSPLDPGPEYGGVHVVMSGHRTACSDQAWTYHWAPEQLVPELPGELQTGSMASVWFDWDAADLLSDRAWDEVIQALSSSEPIMLGPQLLPSLWLFGLVDDRFRLCPAASGYRYLGADGSLTACGAVPHMTDQDLVDVGQSLRDAHCTDCWAKDLCPGPCPASPDLDLFCARSRSWLSRALWYHPLVVSAIRKRLERNPGAAAADRLNLIQLCETHLSGAICLVQRCW